MTLSFPSSPTVGQIYNGEWQWDGTKWVCIASSTVVVPYSSPQGRLTLSTGTPVMSSSVAGATSTFYTPYLGFNVPVPIGGGAPVTETITSDLTQLLSDTTKSPAAAAANSIYDMFVWMDGSTLRCTRGPAWTNSTTRALALSINSGLLVNSTAITNGPGAGAGTYVGTIATNASNQVDFTFGSAASGGGAARLMVWNMYNRVDTVARVTDNGGSYTYTSATIRAARGSANNSISFVCGLAEDGIIASYQTAIQTSATGGQPGWGTALDSTTTMDAIAVTYTSGANANWLNQQSSAGHYAPQIGSHIITATEQGDGSKANTFAVAPAILAAHFRM